MVALYLCQYLNRKPIFVKMKKILIIDDDKLARRILKQFSFHEGFEVEEATDGDEAIKMLKKNEYSIIFCDIYMPNMDGMEVIEKIKELKIKTPLVMISIENDSITIAKTKEMGAFDFIGKPIETKKFIEIVQKIRLSLPSKN